MADLGWYVLGLVLIAALAGAHTALDRWLFSLPRPLPGRAVLVLAGRWTFLAWVLVYAWLIDSRRVPYTEPAIWGLGAVGALLTLGLAAVVLRRQGGGEPRRANHPVWWRWPRIHSPSDVVAGRGDAQEPPA